MTSWLRGNAIAREAGEEEEEEEEEIIYIFKNTSQSFDWITCSMNNSTKSGKKEIYVPFEK